MKKLVILIVLLLFGCDIETGKQVKKDHLEYIQSLTPEQSKEILQQCAIHSMNWDCSVMLYHMYDNWWESKKYGITK
jgi:hypothetical protein